VKNAVNVMMMQSGDSLQGGWPVAQLVNMGQ